MIYPTMPIKIVRPHAMGMAWAQWAASTASNKSMTKCYIDVV